MLANKFLCTAASLIPPQHLFNTLGLIHDRKRNQLNLNLDKNVVFLMYKFKIK